ncbi:nop2/Sun-like domain containing protein 5 [Brevipalpus obovatus]|uniref:nop2/Sun-like domain containing protein 5 n=1 Tax=Brevipalpus obovatus TaxID=246614 RepID=UPI003D9DB6AB
MVLVPSKFTVAARVLNDVKSRKISFKRAMVSVNEEVEEKDRKAIYALVSEALKHEQVIQKMKTFCIHKSTEPLDDSLLQIALCKIIFDKRFHAHSIPKGVPEFDTPFLNRKELAKRFGAKKGLQDFQDLGHIYLRVNRIQCCQEEILEHLTGEGFEFIEKNFSSFEEFIRASKDLEDHQFIKDFNYPKDLLIFRKSAISHLVRLAFYQQGKMVIQDKASFMAVNCLKLEKKMVVVDACCAPGTKTAAMASIFKNDLQIISIDRSAPRMDEMKELMRKMGVTCSKLITDDFIEIVKKFPHTGQIDALLLDPTCSGTGRPDLVHEKIEFSRISKLSGLQIRLLNSALSLKAKRLLYSTCSTHPSENERVIQRALKESENGKLYKIVDPLPEWPVRGDSSYPFGKMCIRSNPECLTKGFFFCYMELIENQEDENEDQGDDEAVENDKSGGKDRKSPMKSTKPKRKRKRTPRKLEIRYNLH